MGRKLVNQLHNGIILLDNLEVVINEKGDTISFRCMHCNKFVSKKLDQFFCPHCKGTFINGIDYDDMKSTQALLNYIEDINDLSS